ncbi:MAG TPA: ImmA/IrrE family metallo-endopeptidase [Clostridiaceae bacterium]|nr:ImmA/IrrE family metallo-endopeptidase [Clostridiaceae bacterium]
MYVHIEKNILEWVFQQCQNSIISEKILMLLEKWIAEEKTPTFNQVETVSKATRIPFGYFFLKEPPEEDMSLLEYRTVDSIELETPSRDLLDTIHEMELIQDWIKEDLLQKGIDPLKFVGAKDVNSDVNDFVNYSRNILGLDLKWFLQGKSSYDSFRYLRNAISDAGVTVMMSGIVGNNTHRALSVDEFRAFTLIDELAPLIFINGNDSYNGKLFSLLHEFNHIVLGENSFYNDRYSRQQDVSKAEVLCNAVAAEILVPNQLFLDEWQELEDTEASEKIEVIAKSFRCGTIVIARRALDARLINRNTYNVAVSAAIKDFREQRKNKESVGGHYYNTLVSRIDRRFLDSLVNSVNTGHTLYTDAFRLTNTNQSTFERLILQVRGELM